MHGDGQVRGNTDGKPVVRSHRDLVVWQKAMDLVALVYHLSERFPRSEMYRLTDQITRAAASVPANIAEGASRGTRRDYAHFLSIAKGSLMETETFLLIAIRLNYLTDSDTRSALSLLSEVERMLSVLRKRLLQ